MRSILLIISNVLLLSVLFYNNSAEQTAGFEIMIDTERSSTFYDSEEDKLGNIIFCGNQRIPLTFYNDGIIIKVTPTGDTLVRRFENIGSDYCLLFDVLILPDNGYVIFGSKGNNDSIQPYKSAKYIWAFRLNENLETLWEKQFEVPGNYWNPVFRIWLCNNDIIYGAGECTWYEGYESRHHFFMVKFNSTGDTLMTKYPFMNDPFGYPLGTLAGNAMGRLNNQEGIIMVGGGFLLEVEYELIEVDSTLNYQIHTIGCPGNYVLDHINVKPLSESTYLLASDLHIVYQGNMDMNVARLNASHDFVDNIMYGRDDTADSPAYRKSIDFVDFNNIYVSSRDEVSWLSNVNSKVSIALLDSSLNMKGWKFYGGDKNYYTWVVTATSDGGCVIGGSIRDWQNNPDPETTDLWIKKIFPEDIITVAEETDDPTDSDVSIFPNPGNEILQIKTFRKNLSFALSDVGGRMLIRKDISDFPIQKIETSSLNKGTYQFQVIDKLKSQVIETGTWIKN